MRRPAKLGRLLIRGVSVLDPRNGELTDDQEILIEGNAIAAIEPVGKSSSDGAHVVEGGQRVALPGLIDCHVHAVGVYLDRQPRARDFRWIPGQMLRNLRVLAESGVTTVRDMAAPLRLIRGFRKMAKHGRIVSPRLFVSGPIFTAPGGYPNFVEPLRGPVEALLGQLKVEVDSAEIARRWIDRLARLGVDFVKLAYSSRGYDDEGTELPRLDDDVIRVMSERAKQHGLPVAVHHTWLDDLVDLLDLPFDTLEHLTADAPIPQWDLGRIVERKLPVTTTLMTYGIIDSIGQLERLVTEDDGRLFAAKPRAIVAAMVSQIRAGDVDNPFFGRKVIETGSKHMGANLLALKKAGVLVGLGTDSGGAITPCGQILWELNAMRNAGLTPLEALRTATCDAARVIGHPELGVLEPGTPADVILCPGNPAKSLDELAQIDLVVRDGMILKNDISELN